jgi:hypothetical protein
MRSAREEPPPTVPHGICSGVFAWHSHRCGEGDLNPQLNCGVVAFWVTVIRRSMSSLRRSNPRRQRYYSDAPCRPFSGGSVSSGRPVAPRLGVIKREIFRAVAGAQRIVDIWSWASTLNSPSVTRRTIINRKILHPREQAIKRFLLIASPQHSRNRIWCVPV